MFRSYKNRIAKNKCLEILPELFAVSGKKEEYRIHLTDSSVPVYLFIFNLFIVFKFYRNLQLEYPSTNSKT